MDELTGLSDALMMDAGFHKHARSWRRKRGATVDNALGLSAEMLETIGKSREKAKEFVDMAEGVDRALLPTAPRLFTDALRDAYCADPARDALETLVLRAVSNELGRELLRRKVEKVRVAVAGTNPSPIEALLAERVALAWLDAHLADLKSINILNEEDFSHKTIDLYDRLRSRAEKRYLAAISALDLVKRRALPSLRVQLAVNGDGQAMAMVEQSHDAPSDEGHRESIES
jgi:hypothetical protein